MDGMKYKKYFRRTQEDLDRANDKFEKRDWKATRMYVKGVDLPKPVLDFDKYPCCGGKGSKWVKKSALSHRMTLVKCDECACGSAKAAS
jgi:hypothetical protein